MKKLLKKFLKVILKVILIFLVILFIFAAFGRWMGHQELKTLIEKGYLDSDYTQQDLSDLCQNPDDDVQPFEACFIGHW